MAYRLAARDAHLPSEKIRRAIVMGDVVAIPVEDDREYLVRREELLFLTIRPWRQHQSQIPKKNHAIAARVAMACTFILLALLIAPFLFGLYEEVSSYCLNCSSQRKTKEYLGLIPVHEPIRVGSFTPYVNTGDPNPCRHEWRVTSETFGWRTGIG